MTRLLVGSRNTSRAISAGLFLVLVTSSLAATAQTSMPPPEPTVARTDAVWQKAVLTPDIHARFAAVVSWRDGFVALGSLQDQLAMSGLMGIHEAPLWLSDDGSNWDLSRDGPLLPRKQARATHLVAFRGGLMAFGTDGPRLLAWRSEDGLAWQRVKSWPAFGVHDVPTGRGYALDIISVVTGHGRVVLSGAYYAPGDQTVYSRVWMSRDGQTWRSATPKVPYPHSAFSLVVGPRVFLGLGPARRQPARCDDDAFFPIESTDGLEWQVKRGAARVCSAHSMAFHVPTASYYMVTRSTENVVAQVLRSKTGARWSQVYAGPTTLDGQAWWMGTGQMMTNDGVIAIVGEGERTLSNGNSETLPWSIISTNGTDWSFMAGWPGEGDADVWAAAMGHGRLVAAIGDDVWFLELPVAEASLDG